MTGGATASLVGFASGLTLDSVPASVRKRAKLSILDALGTALLSTGLERSVQIARAIRGVGPGRGTRGTATAWGYGFRTSPLEAALINGMLVEGLDYSDVHVRAGLHPTSVILPAVVAYAQGKGVSGESVLLAHIIGCETMIRLGLSAPGRFHAMGFQPTSIVGVLGSSLAVGRLMALPRERMTSALGIATTLAFGSSLSVRVGAYFGGVDTGRAAEGGMLAALLAGEGVGAIADDAVEGAFGFLDTHAGSGGYDLQTITQGLEGGEGGRKGGRTTWMMQDTFLKRYPTSYACTFMIDAAIRLSGRAGFDVRQVDEVRFGDNAQNIGLFSEPEEQKRRPPSIYAAKTSHYYLAALALTFGKVDLQLLRDGLRNPEVLRLSDKVTYALDAKSHWVEVRLKDGTTLREEQPDLVGTPGRTIRKKYLDNATPVVGERRAEQVESMVEAIEDLDDVDGLVSLLGSRGA